MGIMAGWSAPDPTASAAIACMTGSAGSRALPFPLAPCDKTQDEPLRVTDRGAWGMVLTIGRVKGEGVVDCKVE